MLDKLLQEIIVVVVGKPVEELVSLLNTQKHINEFNIAKKLGITINQTRNILYKISDYGLVSSIRKKDKKKGWYTYFWKFEILKCLEFLKELLLKKKKEFENELLERQSKVFYTCELCGLEYGEDQALLMDFSCDECGELFTTKDNSKILKELNKNISKIDERLVFVESELKIEKGKLEKKKIIQLRKDEKEKEIKKEEIKLKRAEKKKETARLKEIANPKGAKKKVVKKVVKKVAKKVVKKKVIAKKKAVKKVVKKVAKKK